MSAAMYRFCVTIGRCIGALTARKTILHADRLPAAGGYLLATTHISHLDPIALSVLVSRQIHWMTRIEFYRNRMMAWWLNRMGMFPVRRFGVPVSSIRTAIRLCNEGRIVGVCPEGGVVTGGDSVMRGGDIKRGVLLIAQRSGACVVPVVIAGTYELRRVGPWLPIRRGHVYMNVGEPYRMQAGREDRRVARRKASADLCAIYRSLYQELLEKTDLTDDHDVPRAG